MKNQNCKKSKAYLPKIAEVQSLISTISSLSPEALGDLSDDLLSKENFNLISFKLVKGSLTADTKALLNKLNEVIGSYESRNLERPLLVTAYHKDADYEKRTTVYIVESSSSVAAIETLDSYGFQVKRDDFQSDYDCTGKWFTYGASVSDVKWLSSRKAYQVSLNWYCDV